MAKRFGDLKFRGAVVGHVLRKRVAEAFGVRRNFCCGLDNASNTTSDVTSSSMIGEAWGIVTALLGNEHRPLPIADFWVVFQSAVLLDELLE